jgi:hypothetical protein
MAQAYRRQYALDQRPDDLRRSIALYRDYVAQVPKGGRRADAAQGLAELEPIAARLGLTATGEPAAAPEIKVQTRVAISCPTPGAQVSIDGGKPAPTPLMTEVEPGKRKVRITAEGYFDQEREVDAKKGGVFPVDVTLIERPARVTVAAPSSAQISVDGRLVGVAPLSGPLALSSGKHLISVTMNGYRAFAEEVDLRRGEARTVKADLDISGQRIVSYGMWTVGAGAAVVGVVATFVAVGEQRKAVQLFDETKVHNVGVDRPAELQDAINRRDQWRRVAFIGYGAGAAFGVAGLLLYAFDQPVIDVRPAHSDDRPGAPAPRTPDTTMIEVAVAPVLSPGLAFGSVVGRF